MIVIGENIHATRAVKLCGIHVKDNAYIYPGGSLPIHPHWLARAQADQDRLRPFGMAAWLGINGSPEEREAAAALIRWAAAAQTAAGAAYLDVNMDECGDTDETRRAALAWCVKLITAACPTPICIDSSSTETLRAGLAACPAAAAPMINSVSLERPEVIDLAKEAGGALIVSCAGESGIPATAEERLANAQALVARLDAAGIARDRLFIDPLVLPVAFDPGHPATTLETIRLLRQTFGNEIHITGGFSNISFGMPLRKWLNFAFTRMAANAGADSAILNPLEGDALATDPTREEIRLATAVLDGSDEYGMDFIAFARGE